MKKIGLIAIVSMTVMLVSMLAPLAAYAPQVPMKADTLYVATISWGPGRADPARVYDTGSGELVFNCYDTLIACKNELYYQFEPRLAMNVPDRQTVVKNFNGLNATIPPDPTSTWWETVPADGVFYHINHWIDNNPDGVVGVGDVLYVDECTTQSLSTRFTKRAWTVTAWNAGAKTMTLTHYYYDFIIRTSPTIYFVNYTTGAVVDTFDIYDVIYSLQRGMVADQVSSPQWMYYKALFDTSNSNEWDPAVTGDNATTMDLAWMIKDAIEQINSTAVRINLGIAFPDIAFKQVLAQTWGSIVSYSYMQTLKTGTGVAGAWNGDLFTDSNGNGMPDWWDGGNATQGTLRRISRKPGGLDVTGALKWAGTGPWYVKVFDPVGKIVILQQNPLYYRGWPAPGAPSNLTTVEIRYIDADTDRINGLISGDYDVAAIPRSLMFTILDNVTKLPAYTNIESTANIRPSLSMDAMHFTFTISNNTLYAGLKSLPDGIPLDFFNNTYVRKAFAYSFNWSSYLRDGWFNEGAYRTNVLIDGLAPDYYDSSIPGPFESLSTAEAALKQAQFGGKSVWDQGFTFTMLYNTGNTQRQIVCQQISNFFATLSTYDGRVVNATQKAFTVTVGNILWDEYLTLFEDSELPIFNIGWLADFADADNFIRPYMHSYGDFSGAQNYTADNGWTTKGPVTGIDKDTLIDLAVKTPDGPTRRLYYQDLQKIYLSDYPSFALVIPTGRRWQQYWVRNWYYDALYPSTYYYGMYKRDVCWYDVAGSEAGGQPGLPDGIANTRDVTYLILRFNAIPPDPNYQDPKWVGTYGSGGTDPGPQGGDRICNTKDITFAILHFNHGAGQP
jgi:peptide/nickel transport system substrate-binding protein